MRLGHASRVARRGCSAPRSGRSTHAHRLRLPSAPASGAGRRVPPVPPAIASQSGAARTSMPGTSTPSYVRRARCVTAVTALQPSAAPLTLPAVGAPPSGPGSAIRPGGGTLPAGHGPAHRADLTEGRLPLRRHPAVVRHRELSPHGATRPINTAVTAGRDAASVAVTTPVPIRLADESIAALKGLRSARFIVRPGAAEACTVCGHHDRSHRPGAGPIRWRGRTGGG